MLSWDDIQKRRLTAYSKGVFLPCPTSLITNPMSVPLSSHATFCFSSSLPMPTLTHTCLCTHKAFTSHLASARLTGNTVFHFLVREVTQVPKELGGPEQVSMSVL